MYPSFDTSNPTIVQRHVESIFKELFPDAKNAAIIPDTFQWSNDYFSGQIENYLPIDLRYHNYEHTLQVASCMMYLLKGRNSVNAEPKLTETMFKLGLLAVLMHDTGYLKTKDDIQGTGAKYTLVHVDRSCIFAEKNLNMRGYSKSEIKSVQNMIRCTGVNVDIDKISFQSEIEKILGQILGTSDLLGQMSAENYTKKLPFLYLEFEESFRFSKKFTEVAKVYKNADDLMQNTHKFWARYVKRKIDNDFEKVYRFLNDPYPDGPNEYIENIEANINYLKRKYSIED